MNWLAGIVRAFGREIVPEGKFLSIAAVGQSVSLDSGDAYPALLVDIQRSHQQNAYRDKQSTKRDPVVDRPPGGARSNHLNFGRFSR